MLSLTSERSTWMHRLPAWAKLAALSAATVALFRLPGPGAAALALAGTGALYLSGGAAFAREGLAPLRMVAVFAALILAWHLWTGEAALGLMLALRLLAAVALANLVTLTTRFDAMMALLVRLLSPLRWLGLNPARPAFAAVLVLRFTPVLAEKGARLAEAWRARSPRRPGWQILMPWIVMALDDADHVAEALKARGGLPDDL
ncbi:CbiQ family ECF transporter T component [Frigidibacter oleivorans]|uniref:CbiQ family ECF transporter T component n=1 Tax=Frigidibacter oleivorans TaxID=2487129 RepID=UPI000F8E0E23|nr:CbiQ family ECF transporter T component [Frigidibacter oleivorans]